MGGSAGVEVECGGGFEDFIEGIVYHFVAVVNDVEKFFFKRVAREFAVYDAFELAVDVTSGSWGWAKSNPCILSCPLIAFSRSSL